MKSKLDVNKWEKLEFLYIMDLITIDSQKQRFTLSQFSKEVHLSTTRLKDRHGKVMERIFQRMWNYMNLSYDELFERLRGDKKVPKKLLVLDPGKTTGWSVFEYGKLTKKGELTNCYDTSTGNADANLLQCFFEDIDPDMVLYEDYRVYEHKLSRHSNSRVETIRVIGAIETLCQLNKIPTRKQMAVTAKGFVTDEKLKQWNFWEIGARHARDSIRHGCYFLLFYNKGKDIIS